MPADTLEVAPQPVASDDTRPLGPALAGIVLLGSRDPSPASAVGIVIDQELAVPAAARLRRHLAALLGLPLTRRLIARVEAEVVRHYRSAGQPLVSVITPPQEITDGTLRLRITAFTLGRKTVVGATRTPPAFIASRVRAQSGMPVDATRLQEDLAWLNRYTFRQVSAVFSPGRVPGTTDLALDTREVRPWTAYAGYTNDGSPATGLDRWFVGAQIGGFPGRDALISYQLTASDDAWRHPATLVIGQGNPRYRSHSLLVAMPLGARQQVTLTAAAIESNRPVEAFLVRQRTFETEASYQAALSNVLTLPGDLSVAVEARRQQRSLFFSGREVFESAMNIVQFAVGLTLSDSGGRLRQFISVKAHVSPGGVGRGNDDAAFRDFTDDRVARARYGYIRLAYTASVALPLGFEWRSVVDAQLASGALPNTEQIALGGDGAVRGYSYDDGSFDRGIVWRNELRLPRLTLRAAPHDSAVVAAPFVSIDAAHLDSFDAAEAASVAALGAGVDVLLGARVSASLAGSVPLTDGVSTRTGEPRMYAKIVVRY